MNNVIIVGRIVNDPEVKKLENGKNVSSITVAVPRSYKNNDGIYETDFIDCILWNNVAINTSKYCKKGDIISVSGRIQSKIYENETGKHYKMELAADRITFISSAKEKENSNEKDLD